METAADVTDLCEEESDEDLDDRPGAMGENDGAWLVVDDEGDKCEGKDELDASNSQVRRMKAPATRPGEGRRNRMKGPGQAKSSSSRGLEIDLDGSDDFDVGNHCNVGSIGGGDGGVDLDPTVPRARAFPPPEGDGLQVTAVKKEGKERIDISDGEVYVMGGGGQARTNAGILEGSNARGGMPGRRAGASGANAATAITLDDSDTDGETQSSRACDDLTPDNMPRGSLVANAALPTGKGSGAWRIDSHQNFVDMSFDDQDDLDDDRHGFMDAQVCRSSPLAPTSVGYAGDEKVPKTQTEFVDSSREVHGECEDSSKPLSLSPPDDNFEDGFTPVTQPKFVAYSQNMREGDKPSKRGATSRSQAAGKNDRAMLEEFQRPAPTSFGDYHSNRSTDGDGQGNMAASVAQTGRERARKWARKELGLSLASPASSSGSERGRDCHSSADEADEPQDRIDSTGESRKAAKVAAAKERARRFARDQLGISVYQAEGSTGSESGSWRDGDRDMGKDEQTEIEDRSNSSMTPSKAEKIQEKDIPDSDNENEDDWDSPSSQRTLPSTSRPLQNGRIGDGSRHVDGNSRHRGYDERHDGSFTKLPGAPHSLSPRRDSMVSGDLDTSASVYASPCSTDSAVRCDDDVGKIYGQGENFTSASVIVADTRKPPQLSSPSESIVGRVSSSSSSPAMTTGRRALGGGESGDAGTMADKDSGSLTSSWSSPGSYVDRTRISKSNAYHGDRSSYETAPESIAEAASASLGLDCRYSVDYEGEFGDAHIDGGDMMDRGESQRDGMVCGDGHRPNARRTESEIVAEKNPTGASRGWASPPALASCRRSSGGSSCEAHAAGGRLQGFKCTRCRCSVGSEVAGRADALLRSARDKERATDLYGAMGDCLEAIKLCDDNRELHRTIARIGKLMGCFS